MNFFNKFKDLFEVPSGLSVPSYRLKLDNQLFIEKVYQGTYTQQYSLNNKLRQLKKDYSEFQHEMDEITVLKKTPKRSFSRKGKESEQKIATVSQKNNENKQFPQLKQKIQPKEKQNDYQFQKQKMASQKIKRELWFQDEHSSILKHSQIDHIFNNKLNKIYDLDDIKINTLPKPQINDSFSLDRKQNNNFLIKQKSKKNVEEKASKKQLYGADNAMARRQKAQNTLQFRRKKLEQLLKTLW